jgi:hypothetical protein
MTAPRLLCVGGPLHGLRRPCLPGGVSYVHFTAGPAPLRIVEHKYFRRLLSDGRAFLVWQITPRWPVAGFVKPRRP